MNSYLKKSLTLIELLIAIGLLSVIILAISNIDVFTRFHTISADRRAKLQNEVSILLEHMTKEISKAIGNEMSTGAGTVVFITNNLPNDALIRVYIDANGNGRREAERSNPNPTDDHWLAYRYDGSGSPSNQNQLRYCGRCQDNSCNFSLCMDGEEILSDRISGFVPFKPEDSDFYLTYNYVDIQLASCWQPAQAASPDNPEVVMRAKIKMPSVSTH